MNHTFCDLGHFFPFFFFQSVEFFDKLFQASMMSCSLVFLAPIIAKIIQGIPLYSRFLLARFGEAFKSLFLTRSQVSMV